MKNPDLAKLALMGLTSGVLILNQADQPKLSAAEPSTPSSAKHGCKNTAPSNDSEDSNYNEDNGNIGYHVLSEDELLDELNDHGIKLYNSLSKEGKKLAREVASGRCNKTNLCKGLNACKTDQNECAGKGSCKGKGKCGFADKNLAVEVAAKKMKEQESHKENK